VVRVKGTNVQLGGSVHVGSLGVVSGGSVQVVRLKGTNVQLGGSVHVGTIKTNVQLGGSVQVVRLKGTYYGYQSR
jgi:hypothetical protein